MQRILGKIAAASLVLAVLFAGRVLAAPTVDLSGYNANCGINITQRNNRLQVTWMADGQALGVGFSLSGEDPLISYLGVNNNHILIRDLNPEFIITAGARQQKPGAPALAAAPPPHAKAGPASEYTAQLSLDHVRVVSVGARAEVRFSRLAAGPFSGELVFHFYADSPLLHMEAALRNAETKDLAYAYDAALDGKFQAFAWQDPQDQFTRRSLPGASRPIPVRYRIIMAETGNGTLAVFPPPHTYVFPHDASESRGCVQAGRSRIGLHQDLGAAADPGLWADAPAGKIQHMGLFMLLSSAKGEPTLERVKRYTHGDAFKPLAGCVTMASYGHPQPAAGVSTPQTSQTQKFVAACKKIMTAMGVNIFHDAAHIESGPGRLAALKAMYDACQKNSGEKFLALPGEEASDLIPGSWLDAFPKPVYMTLNPIPGAPFTETIEPYGKVYHPQNAEDLGRILALEHGLGWTAQPRAGDSAAFPDSYKDKDWFKGASWLGATWAAMPADLSSPRLGARSLDRLDEMNHWGQRKMVLGEVGASALEAAGEPYSQMSVNYLRLPKIPSTGDASAILDVLRKGDFFVTTGEVLIRSCQAASGKIDAELEWTFPLEQAELITCDGKQVRRQAVALPQTLEQGRQRFEWPAEGLKDAQWFRLEVWDVAGNGAFTQPVYLK